MTNDIQKLINKSPDPKLIEEAFEFAKEVYKNKNRISGENYIHHAVRVAFMLDGMGLDPSTIAFGILHDAIDDAPESAKRIVVSEIEKNLAKK